MSMFRSCFDIAARPGHPSDVERCIEDTKPAPYDCVYCDTEWPSETDLEEHKRDEHKHKIETILQYASRHLCTVCLNEFPNDTALLSHIKTDHLLSSPASVIIERDIYICDSCNQVFFNKQFLSAHIAYKHNRRKGRVQCPKCHKRVTLKCSSSHYERHEFFCTGCCPICLTVLPNRSGLKEHLKSHPSRYKCNLCSFETMNSSKFKEHLFKYHITSGDDKCSSCFNMVNVKSFFVSSTWTASSLKRELMDGLTLPINMYVCVLCREICLNRINMYRHISVHEKHQAEVKYICTCGESFEYNILLKQHIFKLKGDHKAVDAV